MNGTNLAALATVTPGVVSDPNWKIAGIGDFNGDGQPDILWQHQTTGTLSAWLMNGTNLATLATVTPGVVSDTNWKIVGIADFNNDGQPDILWQHQATGSLSAWLMNGTSLAALATVTPGGVSDTNWKIAGGTRCPYRRRHLECHANRKSYLLNRRPDIYGPYQRKQLRYVYSDRLQSDLDQRERRTCLRHDLREYCLHL